MSSAQYTNELIHEKSPYLLQHAHNPVHWYAWGEKAFEKSRRENKPIFLSIGYSTCHWCHVMEEESFTSEDIAKYLNEHFISIKVDREERPDVDQVYMQAVITMTGAGGWPMSVFLTPELKPFYGGTYFPPQDKWGRPGFITLLKAIQDQWQKDHAKLLESSQKITEFLKQNAESKSAEKRELSLDILAGAFQQFHSQFDPEYGGFGPAPKFPRSHALNLLLRFWKRTKEPAAIEMVERTLQAMADGGMYDQIGGGFHRYSTDAEWHIPHFEKMLYDQALLAIAYLEAYQALHRPQEAKIAREIFDYVLRDMTSPEGGFYSAEDADSLDPEKGKKSEGAFYLWSQEELDEVVGKEAASILYYYYDVKLNGNAAHDPQGEFTGKNILRAVHSIKDTAEFIGRPINSVEQIIQESRHKLLKVRDKRPRPHLDDKVLTDWNGLMIAAFALGARVLKEPRYEEAAKKAVDFILKKMKNKNNRLMHRYRDGEVAIPGFLEDYAFFIYGLIELYETAFDERYLEEAKFLAQEMIRLFWDESGHGFFFSGKDGEQLFTQTKEIYDGAIPSGNSVATYVLVKLSRLLQNQDFEKYARLTLETFSAQLAQYPSGYPFMLMALDFLMGPSQEIVIEGDRNQKETKQALEIIHSRFLPSSVVVLKSAAGGRIQIRICRNFVCENPITDVSQLEKALDKEN